MTLDARLTLYYLVKSKSIGNIDNEIDSVEPLISKFVDVLNETPPKVIKILAFYNELLSFPVLIENEELIENVSKAKLELIDRLLQLVDDNIPNSPGLRQLIYRKLVDDFDAISKVNISIIEKSESYKQERFKTFESLWEDLTETPSDLSFFRGFREIHKKLNIDSEEQKRHKTRLGVIFTLLREHDLYKFDAESYDKLFSALFSLEEQNWSLYIKDNLSTCLRDPRFKAPALIEMYHILKEAVKKYEQEFNQAQSENLEDLYAAYLERKQK